MQDPLAECADSIAGESGGGDGGDLELFGGGFVSVNADLTLRVGGEVAFVDGDEGAAALNGCEQRAFFVVERLGGVEDDEDDGGVGEGLTGALDAELFDFFEGVAEAGGVDEFEGDAVEGDALGDEVAGGAGDGGDDCAIALDEAIEERAFAGVGAPDDGHGKSVMNDAAPSEGGFEGGERRDKRVDAAGDFVLRSDVDIVFAEVDAGFEKGDEFDEGLLDGSDAAAERASHLTGGLAGLGEGLGFDEVANGFGLGEVELAGEEGALGEFAGVGEASAE